jgi:hypothetical protein
MKGPLLIQKFSCVLSPVRHQANTLELTNQQENRWYYLMRFLLSHWLPNPKRGLALGDVFLFSLLAGDASIMALAMSAN